MTAVRIFSFAFLSMAACAAITPHFDPKDWPCGDPQAHYCPGKMKTCCGSMEDCGGGVEFEGCPAGMCCANGGLAATRDAGPRMRPQTKEAP